MRTAISKPDHKHEAKGWSSLTIWLLTVVAFVALVLISIESQARSAEETSGPIAKNDDSASAVTTRSNWLLAQGETAAAPEAELDPQEACANADADGRIAGCTILIEAGDLSEERLASVLATRGYAYLIKRARNRAILDFDQAIEFGAVSGRALCAARLWLRIDWRSRKRDC